MDYYNKSALAINYKESNGYLEDNRRTTGRIVETKAYRRLIHKKQTKYRCNYRTTLVFGHNYIPGERRQ